MPTFPVAIAPSVKTPGVGITVNLLAGQAAPGGTGLRGLLISHKTSSGTATEDTIVEGLAGVDDVITLLGTGSLGHLCAKALYTEHPLAQLDLAVPAAPTGDPGAGTITFGSTPTVARTARVRICGRLIEDVWGVGVSATDIGERFEGLINAAQLPVTALNAAGAITITARSDGAWGNDVTISCELVGGAGGTLAASGANLTAGTTEISLVNVLALVAKQYDFFILCTSNADAVAASATSGPGRIKTHINTYNTGLGARLSQVIVATTGAVSASKAGADQHNLGPMQYLHAEECQSLPCEFLGAEAGQRMYWEGINPNVNRSGMKYKAELHGPLAGAIDDLTPTAVEDALNYGVTPVVFNDQREPGPARPISSYHEDGSGNPDYRILDIVIVSSIYAVTLDVRDAVRRQYTSNGQQPGFALSDDIADGEEEAPEGVVEIGEVRGFIAGRMDAWIRKGVIRRAAWRAAVADGSFIVRVNPSDPTQMDYFMPLKVVPQLQKISGASAHVGPN